MQFAAGIKNRTVRAASLNGSAAGGLVTTDVGAKNGQFGS